MSLLKGSVTHTFTEIISLHNFIMSRWKGSVTRTFTKIISLHFIMSLSKAVVLLILSQKLLVYITLL